ncbi:MAG: CHAT domain-containing protein [Rivularia sp. (in: cyanobacteria)]
MSKLVVINLGYGDLEQGFKQVTAQLWEVGNPLPEKFIASLPPAVEIIALDQNWQMGYQTLCNRLPSRSMDEDDEIEIDAAGITNVSDIDFNQLSQKLQISLNDWLKSVDFLNIDRKLRSALHLSEEIQVIIETNNILLRRLPWHCWDFFDDYPCSAIALSQLEYQRVTNSKQSKFPRQKVRILAVLGNSQGIDLEAEARFLESLEDAEVEFLVQPSRTVFNNYLWDSQGWDILFFAGHSQTEGKTGRIYINDKDNNNNLTIEQLEEALRQAIEKGLKLAIFNSCDGLGLADQLLLLHIPTVIVMREPVPNLVAQKFFEYFLQFFAIEKFSLYLAVKLARRKLQGLENEFPGASWLPVICQNPGTIPSSWLDLGRRPSKISPYRGLFAFQEQDARYFFGRETFTKMLVNAVQNQPLVAVIGSSGSGKSSVVFAGLVKHLRDTQNWHIIDFRPGSRPLFNLATAIISHKQVGNHHRTERLREIRNLAIDLQKCENCLLDVVDDILFENPQHRLLLVADQFEELYTLCRNSQERQAFLDRLLEAINSCPNFTFVITLRADFLGLALSYRPFADALQYADLKLAPMTDEELQAVVEKPAKLLGVTIEEGLTERIVSAVSNEPGDLPLLEFALTQLWEKQQDAQLTHAAYDQIGGVEAALARYADQVYNQLNFEQKERAQRIFIQLVYPGQGTEDTRRVATRKEVGEENWDLVTRLGNARLVVTGRDEKTGWETVEIVHEALIKNWLQLNLWMQLDGDFRRWQEQLRSAMRNWESSGCDQGGLLRGKPLVEAQDWQSKRFIELSAVERSFIGLSVELRDRTIKIQKNRRRLTIWGLSIGLLFASSLAGVAWWQWQNSVKNEIKALSASSQAYLSSNQQLQGLTAAIRAGQQYKRLKLSWVETDTQTTVVKALQNMLYNIKEYNRLLGHKGSVDAVAISPQGTIIATASQDNTVKLWYPDGKLLKTLEGHDAQVYAVAFSHDGQIIASGGEDKTIKLWKQDGRLFKTIPAHTDAVKGVTISPNGKLIASASWDGTVKIWKFDGTLLKTIIPDGDVRQQTTIAFSPNGKMIASGGWNGTVQLWKLDGSLQRILEVNKEKGEVYKVAFSPDGKIIATSADDKTVKLWRVSDGKLLKTLEGHSAAVRGVAFSPDSQIIASVSDDATVKIWKSNGILLHTFFGHNGEVHSVAFSPQGNIIASASEDKTVKLWKLDGTSLKTLSGFSSSVYGVSISPDGAFIATADGDKKVKLWDKHGNLLKILEGHSDRVFAVTFSPDSQIIASAGGEGMVKLWKRDGTWLQDLNEVNKHDAFRTVAFSPDGKMIIAAGDDATVKLWELDGTLKGIISQNTLRGHSSRVWDVSFSHDQQLIASASKDGTVKLWKPDGTLVNSINVDDGEVYGVAISPDSKIIATASEDGTVKLWKRDGILQKTILVESKGSKVKKVIFNPQGNTIATASENGTVKLWKQDGTLQKNLDLHKDEVSSISFSRDGNTLVSGSRDKSVILWNIQQDLSLDELLKLSCDWAGDYLKINSGVSQSDRYLCN